MPTPDSNSTDDTPVYLIHALGGERWFWAYWSSHAAFRKGFAPEHYANAEPGLDELNTWLQVRYPQARELSLSQPDAQEIYRRIRRTELPEEVRQQIAEALKAQRLQKLACFLEAGFQAEDLIDLKALQRRYRQLAAHLHPDRGGDAVAFMRLRELYEMARKRLRAKYRN